MKPGSFLIVTSQKMLAIQQLMPIIHSYHGHLARGPVKKMKIMYV